MLVGLTLVVLVPAKLLVKLSYFGLGLFKLGSQNFLGLLIDEDVLLHLVKPRLYVFALLL